MKLPAGWVVSAGLVLAAWSANAQGLAPHDAGKSPYRPVSDFGEPYGGMPPAQPPYVAPPDAPAAPYGYEPRLIPPHEVYAVLRENGFLPLGIPHRQGYAYAISAIDPQGEEGRFIIDGRTGRIIRFMPAYWGGGGLENSDLRSPYGAQAELPPTAVRGVPRPPAPVPHVANRAIPMPAPKPAALDATAAKRAEPEQKSAGGQTPAEATAAQPQSSAVPTPPAAEWMSTLDPARRFPVKSIML